MKFKRLVALALAGAIVAQGAGMAVDVINKGEKDENINIGLSALNAENVPVDDNNVAGKKETMFWKIII